MPTKTLHAKVNYYLNNIFDYVPYFEKKITGSLDHHAECICVCLQAEFQVPVGSRIFTLPYRPDSAWGPRRLLSNAYHPIALYWE
jgi:hypothetical protein